MSSPVDTILTIVATATASAGAVWGIMEGRARSRVAEARDAREAADAMREDAADALRAAAQARTDDRATTASLIANLTGGYDQLARTMGVHIESLEKRVRDLERVVHERDRVVTDRDNVIRRLREKLHAANGELAKVGLERLVCRPEEIVGGVAPERRDPPPGV